MCRTGLLICACILAAGSVSGQPDNPFELLWRPGTDTLSGNKAQTTIVQPAPPADTPVSGAEVREMPDSIPPDVTSHTGQRQEKEEPQATLVTPPDTTSEMPQDPGKAAKEPVGPGQGQPQIASPLILLLLFGLVFIILTWAVNMSPGIVRKVYRAAFNENFSDLLLREHRFASTQYLYYVMYIVFFVNGGIFLYFASRYSGWRFGYEQSPLVIFIGFVCFVYLIRHLALGIIGNTFPIGKEVTHFNFNIVLYNILLGLILIPINMFLAFGPGVTHSWMIVLGLVAIGLMYLLRQARGAVIGAHLISANVFHFFVYLCTIEILPVLVLLKFFHN